MRRDRGRNSEMPKNLRTNLRTMQQTTQLCVGCDCYFWNNLVTISEYHISLDAGVLSVEPPFKRNEKSMAFRRLTQFPNEVLSNILEYTPMCIKAMVTTGDSLLQLKMKDIASLELPLPNKRFLHRVTKLRRLVLHFQTKNKKTKTNTINSPVFWPNLDNFQLYKYSISATTISLLFRLNLPIFRLFEHSNSTIIN